MVTESRCSNRQTTHRCGITLSGVRSVSALTVTPGILRVGAALPDPPFEFVSSGKDCGFDIELMQAVAAELKLEWRLVVYQGTDFNDIFDGLADGRMDCIASGATVTPDRESKALFCEPYIHSGQSLVCNVEATPQLRSIDDLQGLVLAVQDGNTSQPVAERLKAEGRVGDVRVYAYHDIAKMLDDLDAGRIAAVMKLAPVMHWFVKDRPRLRVVQEGITHEDLAIATGLANDPLRQAIDAAQARLRNNGTLPRLIEKWIGA
jgi:polar amino acid transport system substrate-binding protein